MSVSLMGQTIRHLQEERWDEYSATTCEISSLQTFPKEELWLGFPLCLFDHKYITSSPPALYASQPATSEKHAAVSWEPKDQDPYYECALKLQASGTWEKQAASYCSSWSMCVLELLNFTYNKCKKTPHGDNEYIDQIFIQGGERSINFSTSWKWKQKLRKNVFCYLF